MIIEFALASLLLIAVPGPDQALITRNAVMRGRTAGLRTMLGGASGLTVHAAAAAFGLSALIAASSTAYTMLKLVGIAYLVYLGARMLLTKAEPGDGPAARAGRPFVQGLLGNALNPKVALFFLTFLPQFLPEHGPTLPTAVALSAIFAAIYLAWFTGMIGLVGQVAAALRSPKVMRWTERMTGGTLLAFAARLAAQGRH